MPFWWQVGHYSVINPNSDMCKAVNSQMYDSNDRMLDIM